MNDALYTMYREAMVEQFVSPLLSSSDPLIEAFYSVARHLFVPDGSRPYAYDDEAVPIGEDQMLSQPSVIARVLALAELRPSDKVLDVGSGSGYQAAIAASIAGAVYGLERSEHLAASAQQNITSLGLRATIRVGDGLHGLPEVAPFDAIVFGGAVPSTPHRLLQQLAPNGRLVAPIGDHTRQTLTRWTRTAEGFDVCETGEVLFSPFTMSS